MANQNNTNNQNQQAKKSDATNWILPAAAGAVVGAAMAGAVYLLSKCDENSQKAETEEHKQYAGNYQPEPKGCCAICQDDYEATVTLSCGHILHKNCFEHLKGHSEGSILLCPMCRIKID